MTTLEARDFNSSPIGNAARLVLGLGALVCANASAQPPLSETTGQLVPVVAGQDPADCSAVSFVDFSDSAGPRWITRRTRDASGPLAAPFAPIIQLPSHINGVAVPPYPSGTMSACWWNSHAAGGPRLLLSRDAATGKIVPPVGFALKSDIMGLSPNPGDFMPPAPTLGASSLPLIPPGMDNEGTGWNGISRPVLDNVVDLVTGAPLIRAVDLELPFDGATFRLTRTRSFSRETDPYSDQAMFDSPHRNFRRWWDWAGQGWMVGENPILLVDAKMPDVVGSGSPRCWLILDAHHSIPFEQVPVYASGAPTATMTAYYEAPARFRARMTHNGDFVNGQWATLPTKYDVYLYDGALKYTFVVIREDLQHRLRKVRIGSTEDFTYEWSSMHNAPDSMPAASSADPHSDPYGEYSKGPGLPYIALCTSIQDQYGHVVEIDYCDSLRTSVDNPLTDDCIECMQDCLSKGQIRSIRLKSNGELKWTLLYTHRRFWGMDASLHPEQAANDPSNGWLKDLYSGTYGAPVRSIYELHGSSQIDRIYVYSGDVANLPAQLPCVTTGHLEGAFHSADPIAALVPSTPSLDRWSYCVRHYYFQQFDGCDPLSSTPKYGDIDTMIMPLSYDPLLVRTDVITQDIRSSPPPSSVRRTVYHYSGMHELLGGTGSHGSGLARNEDRRVWLEAIFTESDLSRLFRDKNYENQSPTGFLPSSFNIDQLALWSDIAPDHPTQMVWHGTFAETQSLESLLSGNADSFENKVLSHASVWMPFWRTPEWIGTGSLGPPADAMFCATAIPAPKTGAYVKVPDGFDRKHFAGDSGGSSVRDIKLRGPDGSERFYRIHRMVMMPGGNPGTPPGGSIHNNLALGPPDHWPHRSVLASPYRWRGYPRMGAGSNTPSALFSEAPADWSISRWISIIDEFPSAASLANMGEHYSDAQATPPGVKAGQLSRRVVQTNAAGFVLLDRLWKFDSSGTIPPGATLGSENIYMPVLGLLPSNPQGAMAEFGKQLVLSETRTIGWSAADVAGIGDTKGLIRFFEYKFFPSLIPDPDARDQDWASTVQLMAEGIRSGSDAAPGNPNTAYTRQLFRDPEVPTDTTCEVRFTRATGQLLGTEPVLEHLNESDGFVAIKTITVRADDKPNTPARDQRVLSRKSFGTPRRVDPSSAWFYPVEAAWYDETGAETWTASGFVDVPSFPASSADPRASLTLTRYLRNDLGQLERIILDCPTDGTSDVVAVDLDHPNATTTITGVVIGSPEPGWSRLDAGVGPPLAYVTSFNYDKYGVCDTFLPNGLRNSRRTFQNSPASNIVEWEFNNLRYAGIDGSTLSWTPLTPGEYKLYGPSGGAPLESCRVDFDQNITGYGTNLEFVEDSQKPRKLSAVISKDDPISRMRGAEVWERHPITGNFESIGRKYINDLGEVYREMDLDGSITRRTRNPLGQFMRTYVGTYDARDQYGQPLDGFNMVLSERSEYGSTYKDCWQPTLVRRYTSKPSGSWADDPFGTPPASDPDGIATRTSYDWRMRAVRVDRYGRGDPADPNTPVLGTSLTFLDHADRAALVVEFGYGGAPSDLPASMNPTELELYSDLPTARDFYGLSVRPISIVETLFAPDGSPDQRLTFDMAAILDSGNGRPPHHAERSYKGRGGTDTYQQSPGQPTQLTSLDGVGRVREVRSVRPGTEYELSKTVNVYDADNNLTEVHRWERLVQDTVNTLSGSNAALSITWNWHDRSKRLRATAELGTNTPSGFIINGASQLPNRPTWYPETGGPNIQELPPAARVTYYDFDDLGNQKAVTEPDGTRTESVYSASGRLLKKIEAAGTDRARVTEYEYELGRLIAIKASRDGSGSSASQQVTRVDYLPSTGYAGAEVVDDNFQELTRSFSQVGRMRSPNPAGGEASAAATLSFKYNLAGQIAERTDARGVSFRYHYDGQSRLEKIEVGYYNGSSFTIGYPASMTPQGGAPFDRVAIVEYKETYESDPAVPGGRKRIYETIARHKAPDAAGQYIIAHSRSEHDPRGNMTREYQQIGAAVALPVNGDDTNASPYIAYSWHYAPTPYGIGTSGHNRLVSMQYPKVPQVTNTRQVNLNYDTGLDADLSRLSSFSTTLGLTVSNVASFTYAGTSRRASMSLAAGKITQSWRTADADTLGIPVGLNGLDQFGRPRDLHYRNAAASPSTLYRAEYSYDLSGNRTGAKITQADAPGNPGANTRSQANTYDELNRLIGVDTGALSYVNGEPDVGSPIRTDAWKLDLLGNWAGTAVQPTGPPNPPGRITTGDFNLNGTLDPLEGTRVLSLPVDARNRITNVFEQTHSPAPLIAPVYDAAGNIIFDGTYAYQYDAWGRLVQVNQSGAVLDENGDAQPGVYSVGPLLKQFTYDGLGRLIRAQSPLPDADTTTGLNRTERFYYDGIRRIQEVVIDDVPSIIVAGESGNPGLENLANELTEGGTGEEDGDASPGAFEQQLIGNPGGGGPNPLPLATSLKREYIWGPGDNGLDELLVQYDPYRQAQWALMDSGGDLVALCDTQGTASGGQTALGRVVAQWTFDAYGNVTSAENIALPINAEPHLGHKGMYLERLDVGIVDSLSGIETPRLAVGGYLVTHNRNRNALLPFGRWMQSDPNGTASTVLVAQAFHGAAVVGITFPADIDSQLRDGSNLYQFLSSNAIRFFDTTGLFLLPEMLINGGIELASMVLPGPGDMITGMLESVFAEYGSRLDQDVEWALDWGYGDDWHSRNDSSWIRIAMLKGVYGAFEVGIPLTDISGNPLDLVMQNNGRGGKAAHLWENHHWYPQAKELRKKFTAAGMTKAELDMTERICRDWHKRIHGKGSGKSGAWNDRWQKFFDSYSSKGQTPTPKDIRNQLKSMQQEFGF